MNGLLLVNLGSPTHPTVPAIRRYLREFLMDPYVLDMPYLSRAALVYGLILPFRPHKTLASYKAIWTDEGSPLIVESIELKKALQAHFDKNNIKTFVEIGMRYQDPTLEQALDSFKAKNIKNIKVIPLYPQYALSATTTAIEKLKSLNTQKFNSFFELTFIKDFFNDTRFIQPLIETTQKHLAGVEYDHLLISFHGIPKSQLGAVVNSTKCNFGGGCCDKVDTNNRDCYRAQCFETARLLAQGLNLSKDKWSIGFQSRLTKGWIEPFTDKILDDLPRQGIKKLAVVCPSFISDCLETLEEINIRERERFLKAGGEHYHYIPCVNHSPSWVKALGEF